MQYSLQDVPSLGIHPIAEPPLSHYVLWLTWMLIAQGGQTSENGTAVIVTTAPTCLHALDGRLRLKIAEVKGSPQKASEIESQLRGVDGIEQVKANPTTGSVLIIYNSDQVKRHDLYAMVQTFDQLLQMSKLWNAPKDTARRQGGFGKELARTVVRSALEFALQRWLHAFI
jgi:hypothetical protein